MIGMYALMSDNDDFICRRGVSSDVTRIYKLEKQCMEHPWTETLIADLFTNPYGGALVVEQDSELIGYVGFTYVLDEMEIGNICVLKEYRRRGLAQELFKKLFVLAKESEIKKIFLEVNSNNIPAQTLYSKLGFKQYSVRKNYYGNQQDALMMVFEL